MTTVFDYKRQFEIAPPNESGQTFKTVIDCWKNINGSPVAIVIGAVGWVDIMGGPSFKSLEDIPEKMALLTNGYMGTIENCKIWTDCYMHPTEQFLAREDLVCLFADGRAIKYRIA